MSSFIGHALPGIFFVFLGMWWTINIFRHFFASKGNARIPFRSQPWYPGPFGVKFPIESALKVIGSFVAIAMDLVAMMQVSPLHFVHRNAVHITIFFFFGLNGTMDLLKYKGLLLPDGIEAASGLLALGVECFLLSGHIQDGRPMLDIKVHTFDIYITVAIILSIFLEIQYPHYVVPSLTRAFFTLLQGTWLWQVGFIISPPLSGMREWDMMDHELVMLASLIFTWHLAAIFVFILLIFTVVWLWTKCDSQFDDVGYHLLLPETKVLLVSR